MRRLISFLIGIPIFIILAALALANRQRVTVSFDPITPETPLYSLNVPLWVVFFAGIFLGLVAGGIATWLKQGRYRARARHAERELARLKDMKDDLEKELKQIKEQTSMPDTAQEQPQRPALPAA